VLVEERAAFGREGLGSHNKYRNREGCEHDKGYNACRPPEQRGVSNCFFKDVSGVKEEKFAVLSEMWEGLKCIG
jgi:hypothetical protein